MCDVSDLFAIDEVITLQNIEPLESTGKSKKNKTAAVYNEDIKRIRAAEKIIMNSEAKFGVMSRDPFGRLVPILQVMIEVVFENNVLIF